jgi:hypothetical protein
MIQIRRKVIVLSVVIGLMSVIAGNNILENYRLRNILKVVIQTESEMIQYKEALRTSFKAPKGCIYAGTDRSKKYCGFNTNKWVTEFLVPQAKDLRDSLTVGDFELERVSVFPLSGDYALAKEKYHLHLLAWISLASDTAGCTDYMCFYNRGMKDDNISSSFKIAKIVFYDAVPTPNFFGNKAKVEQVFKD